MTGGDESYLEDMLSYALDAIELLADAVTRAVEIVGEAATRVSAERRAALPDIPWRAAIGMRNILIHGYAGLDAAILANTVRGQFPTLVEDLRKALGESAP